LEDPVEAPLDLVLAAADAFVELAGASQVATQWSEVSACPPYTVGGLVAHTTAGLAWAAEVLGRPPMDEDDDVQLLAATRYWTAVDAVGDVHAALEADGNRRAAKGAAANRAHLARCVERLEQVAAPSPGAVVDLRPTPPVAMTADDFAATRLLELVVHGDDVAASVGATLRLDPAVADAVLAHALQAARDLRGDLPVLRAFVRGERAADVLPVV
jgi:uncharacterized protein (TIGR03083 family)